MKTLIKTTLASAFLAAAAAMGAQAQSANEDVGVTLQLAAPEPVLSFQVLNDLSFSDANTGSPQSGQVFACLNTTFDILNVEISSQNTFAVGAAPYNFLRHASDDEYISYRGGLSLIRDSSGADRKTAEGTLTSPSFQIDVSGPAYVGALQQSDASCTGVQYLTAPEGNVIIDVTVPGPTGAGARPSNWLNEAPANRHYSIGDFVYYTDAQGVHDFSDVVTLTFSPALGAG